MIYVKKILANGKTLTLKEAEPFEAARMIKYLNVVGGESENLLFGEGEFRFTVEQEEEIISQHLNSENDVMLVGVIDHEIVAVALLTTPNRSRIRHNAQISLSVRKDYWNLGIGSFIMNELITFATNHPVIRVISLEVKEGNESAIHLYKKYGFEMVGRHKDNVYLNHQYHDILLMDLYLEK